MEVVADPGAGPVGGQAQVLLGIAEVELDTQTVPADGIHLLRCHVRVALNRWEGRDGCRSGLDLLDTDHVQQTLEGVAVLQADVVPTPIRLLWMGCTEKPIGKAAGIVGSRSTEHLPEWCWALPQPRQALPSPPASPPELHLKGLCRCRPTGRGCFDAEVSQLGNRGGMG